MYRLAAVHAVLLLASCSEALPLGSACATLDGCPPEEPREERDAQVTTQARPDAARPVDAGRPRDAKVTNPPVDAKADADPIVEDPAPPSDAAPPERWGKLPALANLSFERKPGSEPGDVTVVSSLPGGTTTIAPWYTCQPIGVGNTPLTAVRSEATVPLSDEDGGALEVIMPTDGESLVSMGTFANVLFPLVQPLEAPLQPGTRYTFALDVRALTAEPLLALQVWGSDNCLREELLFESGFVSSDRWQTICFDFTPRSDHGVLVLLAKSDSPLSGRLLFDNLRDASACE